MLDLSKLYQTTLTDSDGVQRTYPCKIISFNTVTEKYTISIAGMGNVLIVNAGDLETTDQSEPTETRTIDADGSYDVSSYAGVTVNVNNLGSLTVTNDGTVNSTHYSSVVVNVNNEDSPLAITEYADDIDTTHYSSVDTTALEPTGTETITQNGTYNVKDKASVTVSVSGGSATIVTVEMTYDSVDYSIFYPEEHPVVSDKESPDTGGVYQSTYYVLQGDTLTYEQMPVNNLEGEFEYFTWYDENGNIVLDSTHTEITVNDNIILYNYQPEPPEPEE